ncbi:uncharacterized protein LOC34620900 [Cyclospora cayetanensis]|uniref:Uncharacterized protein LOC34620900 n=1 Tax=Cyclospora cayetanensis TaxID=88456 RepID=A0A6P6S253_9EIME|nr:uncharacterized protein LOC34620900 [Cyclospora cayetanensis]
MGGSGEAFKRLPAPLSPQEQLRRLQQHRPQQILHRSSSSSSLLGGNYSYPVSLLRTRTQLPQLQDGTHLQLQPQQQHSSQHEDQRPVPLRSSEAQTGTVQQQMLLQSTRLPMESRLLLDTRQDTCTLEQEKERPHALTAPTCVAAEPKGAAAAGSPTMLQTRTESLPETPSCRESGGATAQDLTAASYPAKTAQAAHAISSGEEALQHATATTAAATTGATAATTATEAAEGLSGAAEAAAPSSKEDSAAPGGLERGLGGPFSEEAIAAPAIAENASAAWRTRTPPANNPRNQPSLQPPLPTQQPLQQRSAQSQCLQNQQAWCPPLPVPAAPPPQICLIGPRLLAMRSPWNLSTSGVLQRNGINELMLYLCMLQSLLLPARWGGLMPLGDADCPAAAAVLPAAAAAAAAAEGMSVLTAAADASPTPPPSQAPSPQQQQQLVMLLLRRFLQQLPTPSDGSSGLTLLNGLYRHLHSLIKKQQESTPVCKPGFSLVAQAAAAASAALENAAALELQGEEAAALPAVAAAVAAVEAAAAAAAAAAATTAAAPSFHSLAPFSVESGRAVLPAGEKSAGGKSAEAASPLPAAQGTGDGSSFDMKRREALRQLGRLLASPPVIVVFDIYSRGSTTCCRNNGASGSHAIGGLQQRSSGSCSGNASRQAPCPSSAVASTPASISSGTSSLAAEFGEAFGWQILEFSLTEVGSPPLQLLVDFCSSLRFWLQLDRHLNLAVVNLHPKSGCGALLLLACAAMACGSSLGAAGWSLSQHQLLKMLGNASLAAQDCTFTPRNLKPSSVSGQGGGGVLHWKPADRWPPSCRRYLSYFESLLRQGFGSSSREEGGAGGKLQATGVEARSVRLKNVLIDHFAAPAALIVVEVYELATCCCCCSGCCSRRQGSEEQSSVLVRHFLASSAGSAATAVPLVASGDSLPLGHPVRQSHSSSSSNGSEEQAPLVSMPSATAAQPSQLQLPQQQDMGGSRSQRKGFAGYFLKQRTPGKSQQQLDGCASDASQIHHPFLQALRQQTQLLTECAGAAASAVAAIESACSPDDVPLLFDPGGPLGYLGACCDAYVSLPISAPCLSSSSSRVTCCCPAVASACRMSWSSSADDTLSDGGSPASAAAGADWPVSPTTSGEAPHAACEGGRGALAAGRALAALQQRQLQQHLQQRHLQQQHQRELHTHFSLQACASDYQLMAADSLSDGSASAVFDFAHARDGSPRHLVLSGDVLIAIRQLVPRLPVTKNPADSGGSHLLQGACEGLRKANSHRRHLQQQQHIYATYSLHTGFLPSEQSVIELRGEDLDSSTPLSQRLRVSLIFEHVESGPSSSSSSSSSASRVAPCSASSTTGEGQREEDADIPPSGFVASAAVSTEAAHSTVGSAPSAGSISSSMSSSSSKSPPSKSLVSGIMSSLLRWQQPRDTLGLSSGTDLQHRQQQQLHAFELHASRRGSTCSSTSGADIGGASLLGAAEHACAAAAASAAAHAGDSRTAGFQRHLHITKRPTPSRREFAARHCLRLDPRLLQMLVEASGCSSDSCAVALKLCSNDFSMAMSLVSYYFAAAGAAAAASAAAHATRLLQHALPPPWLQQQHLLQRQVSHYLQLQQQEQQGPTPRATPAEGPSVITPPPLQHPQESTSTFGEACAADRGNGEEELLGTGIPGSLAAPTTGVARTLPLLHNQQWIIQHHHQGSLHQPPPVSSQRPSRIAPVPLRPGQSRRLNAAVSPTAAASDAPAIRPLLPAAALEAEYSKATGSPPASTVAALSNVGEMSYDAGKPGAPFGPSSVERGGAAVVSSIAVSHVLADSFPEAKAATGSAASPRKGVFAAEAASGEASLGAAAEGAFAARELPASKSAGGRSSSTTLGSTADEATCSILGALSVSTLEAALSSSVKTPSPDGERPRAATSREPPPSEGAEASPEGAAEGRKTPCVGFFPAALVSAHASSGGEASGTTAALSSLPSAGPAGSSSQLLAIQLPDGRVLRVSLPSDVAVAANLGAEGTVVRAAAAAASFPGVSACGDAAASPPSSPPKDAQMSAAAGGSPQTLPAASKGKAPGQPPPRRPPPPPFTTAEAPAAAGKANASKPPPPPSAKATAKAPGPPPKGFPGGKRPPPAAAASKQQPLAEAALPLGRKIHWKALSGDKIHGTVFSEMPALGPLGPSALVDGAALSRLFSRTQSSAATKAASKRATKRPEVQQVKLISSKRAQNVAIVLARLSLSTKEAARRLQCLDSSGFSLELLDRLEQVCPLPEELEAFQAYLQQQEQQQTSEDPKADSATTPPLRDVEAEMLPLVRLTGVSLRTRVVRFDLLAPKTLKELNDALDLVDQAAEQGRSSRKFRVLLQAVLQWGNYVNHGVRLAATPEGTQSSEEGGAAGDSARGLPGAAASVEALPTRGFALTSLLKLMEFRSTVDSRLSSLHYILVNLMASLPDLRLEGLPEEMPLVEEAARLSDEALDVAAALLHRETQFLLQQIQQAKPSNEFWGPSEIEKLRRLHGEAALGFQGVRQRYAASKERVTELARFYGEEPQRPSAAAAAAAGEGWGGLMRASPFSTLAAILVTFKQTLRDIQQHPKRYAVLLATNSSTSDPKQGNAEEERRGKKEAPSAGESASPGEPPFAAALPKKDQGATFKAPAIAATTGSQLHAHFTRKCSDPIAATCATPRGLRGLGAALMQPEHHHHQPCTPPRRSASYSALAPPQSSLSSSSMERKKKQQQQQDQQQAVPVEQTNCCAVQQPHGHETSVAVRLPVSGPPSASEGIAASVAASGPANPKDAQAKRPHGLTAAAAAALLAKSNSKLDAKSYRASLHALLDEPSFPALDLAASINKALFVRELSGEEGRGSELPAAAAANEAAGASVESHSTPREPAKAAERTQQMLRAVQAPLPAVATSPRLPGNLGNDSEHQKRAVASVGNVQFFPPRVVPKQLQRLPSTPPHVWRPILRPRLPPPAVVPGKYPRGSQNKAVPPTIGEGRGKQQPNAQER